METSFEKARFNMIQQQVRPWDVTDDRVLEAMAEVPRERFVPDAYRALAYADMEIPLGEGQSMLAPKVVGRMLQALQVGPGDRALEIGTGTGYVTACLARLAGRLVSLEVDPALAAEARANLDAEETQGLELREGDGLSGPVDGGPFDVIAVTGSLPDDQALPSLLEQLAPGGRLFVVIGEDPVMEATLITRSASGAFSRRGLFETSIPPLAKVPETQHFVF
jgi:protein-L-isoaspartate(D-aspartate) O-methyltransferase